MKQSSVHLKKDLDFIYENGGFRVVCPDCGRSTWVYCICRYERCTDCGVKKSIKTMFADKH